MGGAENFGVWFECDNRPAAVRCGAKRFEFPDGMSARKTLAIQFAVARDFDIHPFRKRIHHGCADAMQPARRVIDFATEFSAGMQSRHDHFERGFAGEFRMAVHGNSAAIVAHGQYVVGLQFDFDASGMAGDGFVHRVIEDFGNEPVRPKLAISLNASNEAARTEVMPITKKWTIEKLMTALREFPLRNRERLTFEYVLLGGVNDDVRHAREVVELIRGLRAKVNLIALNPGPDIPFDTPSEERVQAFQNTLIRAGIPAFVRRPRGRDIYAACGQLKRTTELVSIG